MFQFYNRLAERNGASFFEIPYMYSVHSKYHPEFLVAQPVLVPIFLQPAFQCTRVKLPR